MRLIDADKLRNQLFGNPYADVHDFIDMIHNIPTENAWIPCSERLPEEKINPITDDYYEYPVTALFGKNRDVRYYKFGGGHWWHGFQIIDKYVVAWQPLLESWEGEND